MTRPFPASCYFWRSSHRGVAGCAQAGQPSRFVTGRQHFPRIPPGMASTANASATGAASLDSGSKRGCNQVAAEEGQDHGDSAAPELWRSASAIGSSMANSDGGFQRHLFEPEQTIRAGHGCLREEVAEYLVEGCNRTKDSGSGDERPAHMSAIYEAYTPPTANAPAIANASANRRLCPSVRKSQRSPATIPTASSANSARLRCRS